jgi:hypothetical protein
MVMTGTVLMVMIGLAEVVAVMTGTVMMPELLIGR